MQPRSSTALPVWRPFRISATETMNPRPIWMGLDYTCAVSGPWVCPHRRVSLRPQAVVTSAHYDARWFHRVLCGAYVDDRHELVTETVAIVVQANLQGERHDSSWIGTTHVDARVPIPIGVTGLRDARNALIRRRGRET